MSRYIINNLIRLMENAEELSDLKTGKAKKKYVMDELQILMVIDPLIEGLILEFIDVLIEVDKNNITFNKDIKKGCLSFIKKIC
jgi:hypothetical protein